MSHFGAKLLPYRYRREHRDFAHMGRGIQARYDRCRRWWEPHLHCSREFVEESLVKSDQVLVLGAGRLLDLDLAYLRGLCGTIHLYDSDPGCWATWKEQSGPSFGSQVIGHIKDCTETLEVWTRGLQEALAENMLGPYLQGCRAPNPSWSRIPCDGVISLNLLGQIPLYWRDRVLACKSNLNAQELLGLESSMGELQRAHIEALSARKDTWSILLTDSEYYFYHSDRSDWRIESALYGASKALFERVYASSKKSRRWFWHVSPQYIECDDEGEIHRVEALYTPGSTINLSAG